MSTLKQRVALSKDRQGNDLFITLEWLKDLQAVISEATPNVADEVTRAQFEALTAQVNAMQAQVKAIALANADLIDRVTKLEGGYQS